MWFNFDPTCIGPGIFPMEFDAFAINKSGGSMIVGDVVAYDLAAAGSGVTSVDPGGTIGTSIYNSVVAPTAAHIHHGYVGVVISGGIVGAEVKVRLCGLVDQAFVIDSAASVAIGDPLIATTAKNLDGNGTNHAVNTRIIARSRQIFTTPTTRTLGKVELNGITGFATFGGT